MMDNQGEWVCRKCGKDGPSHALSGGSAFDCVFDPVIETPKIEIDFDAALEAGAKAYYEDMKKRVVSPPDIEWDDLDSMTRFSIKESILPIVNAALLTIK